MKYLILVGMSLSSISYGQNTDEINSIIAKMQPNNSVAETVQIAREVEHFSQKTNLDWKLILAIFAQESTFQKDPQNCVASLQRCHDFGIGQINYKTWGAYFKLDKKRLVTDYHYSIKSSVDILVYYRHLYGSRDANWYLHYHSSTPEFRDAYHQRISVQYARINKYLREFRDGREREEKIISYRRWRILDPSTYFGSAETLYAGTTSALIYSSDRSSPQVCGTLQLESIFSGAFRKRRPMA